MILRAKVIGGSGSLTVRLLLLVIAFCFALSANTLYCNLGDRSMRIRFEAISLICSTLVVLLLWLKTSVSRLYIQRWVLFAVFVAASYCTIVFFTRVTGGLEVLLAVAFLSLSPIFCKLLTDTDNLRFLIDAFILIAVFLASSSLLLYLLGPISGLMPSNCSIQSSWGTGGIFVNRIGWYGLLFETQYIDDFGFHIARNTGIFCEAPMFSFVLAIAMLFERYFRSRPRVSVLLILAAAIVTTMSTTGMIVVLLVVAEMLYTFGDEYSPHIQALLKLFFAVALVAIGVLGFSLFNQKMGTGSGATRVDDYVAGFKAWTNNILLGNGFSDESIKSYMSAFRGGNLGFSNSPMEVLAKGGLLWFTTFLVCIIGFFQMRGKQIYGMLCFLFIWTVTIVTWLPLTLFCFGLGSCAFFSKHEFTDEIEFA